MKAESTVIYKKDLDDYFRTLSNRTKIRKIRSAIINRMPFVLRSEFKKLENDLICVNETLGIYQLYAWNASSTLKDYLERFQFILEKK